MTDFSTIICCINFTENNEDIIKYTKQISKLDTKILIVHTIPSIKSLLKFSANIGELLEEASRKLKNNLEMYKSKYFADYHNVETILVDGTADTEILKVADKYCAECIVMGTLSSSNWFHFFLPNHSNSIAHQTRIPIFLIPNDLSLECMPEV